MSDLDYDALRKVAEAATPGPWERAGTDGMGVAIHRGEHDTIALYADRPNAEHIATFDPPTVLRLLDLAQRAEAVEQARESIRAHMVRAPSTLSRDTYADGYLNGLAEAIGILNRHLRAALDPEENS